MEIHVPAIRRIGVLNVPLSIEHDSTTGNYECQHKDNFVSIEPLKAPDSVGPVPEMSQGFYDYDLFTNIGYSMQITPVGGRRGPGNYLPVGEKIGRAHV